MTAMPRGFLPPYQIYLHHRHSFSLNSENGDSQFRRFRQHENLVCLIFREKTNTNAIFKAIHSTYSNDILFLKNDLFENARHLLPYRAESQAWKIW